MEIMHRRITDQIKGMALILMFAHHFFTFPEWWMEGISYPLLASLSPWLSSPSKICVCVFCFLTGYFYYYKKEKTYAYSLGKIKDILIAYWVVYLILGFVAFLVNHSPYRPIDILLEMFALRRPTMVFAWYVSFYGAAMLLLPLLAGCLGRRLGIDLLLIGLVIPGFFAALQNLLLWTGGSHPILQEVVGSLGGWLPVLLAGYLVAEYRIFEKLYRLEMRKMPGRWQRGLFSGFLMLLSLAGRLVLPGVRLLSLGILDIRIPMDVFYGSLFVYGLMRMCMGLGNSYLQGILGSIGRYSLLMWFFSCIFFNPSYEIFQPILYMPKIPLLVLIWGLILCMIPSLILTPVIRKLQGKG